MMSQPGKQLLSSISGSKDNQTTTKPQEDFKLPRPYLNKANHKA